MVMVRERDSRRHAEHELGHGREVVALEVEKRRPGVKGHDARTRCVGREGQDALCTRGEPSRRATGGLGGREGSGVRACSEIIPRHAIARRCLRGAAGSAHAEAHVRGGAEAAFAGG